MKKHIIIWIGIIAGIQAQAQQDAMLSQYMFNGLFLNPAYSGTHNYVEATALYRTQWTGMDGAPTTQTFGIDGPLSNELMGVGLTFVNDQIGDTRQTEVFANWSYHLLLDKAGKTKFSFGVRAGVSNYTSKLTETYVFDTQDPVFSEDQTSEYIPKFGAGIYFYSEKWYAGLSVPTIFAADKNIRININNAGGQHFESHAYLTAGYVWKVNQDLAIKPSFLMKYVADAPIETDINCNLLIKNTFWIGASYRTGDAVVGILEYNISNFRIGYSYDFTTSELNDYNSGSHEIMLSYKFSKEPIKTKTPRYF